MEFGLSDEQRLLDETLRAFLADRVPLETLRQVAETGIGVDSDARQGYRNSGSPAC